MSFCVQSHKVERKEKNRAGPGEHIGRKTDFHSKTIMWKCILSEKTKELMDIVNKLSVYLSLSL